MAKKDDPLAKGLIIAAGAILLLPFLLIGFISFSNLKEKYLESDSAQRVVDMKRLLPTAIGASTFLVSCALMLIFFNEYIFAIIVIVIVGSCVGVMAARRLAILYLGIVADKGKDLLVFPHDMQSYTIMDYFSLRFLEEYGQADTLLLSEIKRMTRGRGKELYIHGNFGSRGIIMSSKQKRDECMSMIQVATGKKGLLFMELEGFEN